jgi:hypothetical protein
LVQTKELAGTDLKEDRVRLSFGVGRAIGESEHRYEAHIVAWFM